MTHDVLLDSPTADDQLTVEALHQRLTQVWPLLPGSPPEPADPNTSRLLDAVVRRVHAAPASEYVWLLITAVTGAFPTPDQVTALRRTMELSDVLTSTLELLDLSVGVFGGIQAARRRITIVQGATIVDVDHVGSNNHHTGIQQVVRQTLPEWAARHRVELIAWSSEPLGYRPLTPVEQSRVLRWSGPVANDSVEVIAAAAEVLVVPWRSVIVLIDAQRGFYADQLVSIASQTGNRVVLVGYDMIPIVSAHLVPVTSPGDFASFLSIVKFCKRIAGISESAAEEFRGFVDCLPTQGLVPPIVVACPLAEEAPDTEEARERPERRFILTVGTFEPRKNHLAVLHAAEVLWREGIEFDLRMMGGGAYGQEVFDLADRLRVDGRAVSIEQRVSHEVLVEALATAEFLVFPSLHEGYGLPVVEAISLGTPAITSDFGSLAELCRGGGALAVDPRDDQALVDAMRGLLNDPVAAANLRYEIAERATRSWAQYADQLWSALIQPELDQLTPLPVATDTTVRGSLAQASPSLNGSTR